MAQLMVRVNQSGLASICTQVASVVDEAIQRVGVTTRNGTKVFAYEVGTHRSSARAYASSF